ncbi:MAG: hypothetical protein DRI86_07190 [Bacteroidetes bacterium]|nr:MAG: hypothetical protein DRI86_07190 [Bacteroidota bacterium]
MKLLIITSRVPWPLDKGDKLRIYHQIRYLSKTYEIELIALSSNSNNDIAIAELSKYCGKINFLHINRLASFLGVVNAFFGNRPLQIGYFYNSNTNNKIQKIIAESKADFVFGQLIRVAEYIRYTKIHKVLDLQDAFSKGLERRAAKAKGFRKFILNIEYRRMLAYEENELDDFGGLSIITQADKDLLPLRIQERTLIVPNGVDFDFFKKQDSQKKYDIVFTGNMNYAPNIMAAIFLVKDIMPLVWKKYEKVRVLLAGASPHASVKALRGDRVVVSGWIDDIRDAYSESEIFVAPMQIGIGLQNKLLEAMAMEMPCVTSELANQALKAIDGKQVLISENNDAGLFAEQIIKLITDKNLAEKIAKEGHSFVKDNYDWESAVDQLGTLFVK